MTKTSQQKTSGNIGSTQKFTEVQDIVDNIVLLANGNACLVVEVSASNFALLSKPEQDAKISAYASLLNSLSFPIQILIQNRAIDVSSYLHFLDAESQKYLSLKTFSQPLSGINSKSPLTLYREFIQQLVSVKTVLDKKFYIIISYSYLEKGVKSAASMPNKPATYNFTEQAKATLHTKSESLHAQLARLSVQAKVLEKEELIKLFYEVFNQAAEGNAPEVTDLERAPIITTKQ